MNVTENVLVKVSQSNSAAQLPIQAMIRLYVIADNDSFDQGVSDISQNLLAC